MNQPPPPFSLEDVTPSWVDTALASVFEGVQVTSLHLGRVIGGAATKVRLLLEYNQSGHERCLPPTMWLKAGLDPEKRALHGDGYIAEGQFYRELASQVDVHQPTCYYTDVDVHARQSVLLLEDLLARHATFGAGTVPLKADVAATALELIARLHARWWGTGPPGWSGANVWQSERHLAHFFSPVNWDTYLNLPRAVDVPDELRARSRVEQAVLRMWETDRELPRCFAHGDAQLPNMYFGRDGVPGFLDFGTVTTSTWALDVPYFLIGSLTVSDRRNHERDLLKHYLGRLQAHGVDEPKFNDAWLTYRRHALHGFLLITTPEGHFPEQGVKANVDRFASAIVDLESLASVED